jgi:hypothetical protein
MRSPLRIAFLGIDWLGKTALADQLRDELESRGIEAVVVSWSRILRGEDQLPGGRYPNASLEQLSRGPRRRWTWCWLRSSVLRVPVRRHRAGANSV